MTAFETSILMPNVGFVLVTLVYVVLAVVWPAVDAARQGRWLWVVAIILLSPFAGALWCAIRVAESRRLTV
ncbi:hypothetical protein [Nocardioides sp. URHA0020]|uniref:hypothetical protein n=1 Tax=Nocardioides sp. URHA0020 TaxID=1380392 RepID=UPI00048DB512|nr:hypothetical protein [Nocardioides sp. URHA0020]